MSPPWSIASPGKQLQQRRQQTKAIMMFRLVHAMVAIPAAPHLQLLGAATRGHQYRYRVPYCRTNTYKSSFFPSTIRLWNQLPEKLTAAKSRYIKHKARDSKMILSCFSLFLTSLGHSQCVYKFYHQCHNAGATGLAL